MLTVDNLVKTFNSGRRRGAKKADGAQEGRVLAVNDISFRVKEGELFTLLGPSGCGKTTTLRSVAGLESPDHGSISVGGNVLFAEDQRINVPANRRKLGMVFQSYAIWPHMTVYKNVSFPLEVAQRKERLPKHEMKERVARVLEVTKLAHLADRPATTLSGGQQQRLAFARALVGRPALILLDEPLSNLDAKLRESMRYELKRLQRELGLTSVYVTHDQTEALALSNVVAVMCDGKIVQVGRPREIYERPNCHFVADFIGTSNFVSGTVKERRHGEYRVETQMGSIWASSSADLAVNSNVLLSIRPEHVSLSRESQPDETNELLGKVTNRAFLGDSVDHILDARGVSIRNRSNPKISIEAGTEVYFSVPVDRIVVIPLDS
ncbi:MAG: ABC transporter ATP-binding protein [Thermoleophilia bacterium]